MLKGVLLERFTEAWIEDANGCWLWQRSLKEKGYGQFRLNGKTWRAHRLAFTHYVRPLEPGEILHHSCEVPSCVRPGHLVVLGSAQEHKNVHVRELATHCGKGHEFTPENTYMRLDRPGSRECRECQRIRNRKAKDAARLARAIQAA